MCATLYSARALLFEMNDQKIATRAEEILRNCQRNILINLWYKAMMSYIYSSVDILQLSFEIQQDISW